MKIIFYQANFCAECGNAMKPRFSLGPRYFCDECEAHMGRRNYFKSVAGLLLCATLAVFALNRTFTSGPSGQAPNAQPNPGDSTPAVSARDTVAERGLSRSPKPLGASRAAPERRRGRLADISSCRDSDAPSISGWRLCSKQRRRPRLRSKDLKWSS